jgi:hypothetical protein
MARRRGYLDLLDEDDLPHHSDVVLIPYATRPNVPMLDARRDNDGDAISDTA